MRDKKAKTVWNRRLRSGDAQRAERQEQRERDRQRHGHSWGFLHQVEAPEQTRRMVGQEMMRWSKAKAEAAAQPRTGEMRRVRYV